jgi:hypothetical protein
MSDNESVEKVPDDVRRKLSEHHHVALDTPPAIKPELVSSTRRGTTSHNLSAVVITVSPQEVCKTSGRAGAAIRKIMPASRRGGRVLSGPTFTQRKRRYALIGDGCPERN